MIALARLARARQTLAAIAAIESLLWGVATTLVLLMIGNITAVAAAGGIIVTAARGWMSRRAWEIPRVALWLEERDPSLRYSLVTLAEGIAGPAAPRLEALVAGSEWGAILRRQAWRRTRRPGALVVTAIAVTMLQPSASAGYFGLAPGGPAGSGDSAGTGTSPFRSFRVTVTPPAYSRLETRTLRQPDAVSALVGSRIEIAGETWRRSTVMPDTATPFWLEEAGERRLLPLLPVTDSVPSVLLLSPSRDSVLRAGSGRVELRARLADDFGLAGAWFEYIVSAGEGETFTFRTGTLGRRDPGGSRSNEIVAALVLDTLGIQAGNVLHLRAVARDGNTTSGPGTGYSETRTFRVLRPGEGDSVSIGQVAPAEGDSSLLSQRMLIMMAEALERRRRSLARDSVIAESRRIAGDQATLRRRVADIIFLRLGGEGSMEEEENAEDEPLTPEMLLEAAEAATTSGGETLDFSEDETPVVMLNRPLLEAYNAMWAAGRELEVGAPARALPHMREALEAIQRARQAERLYLRGRPAPMVVDLARVRLAGRIADAAPAGRVGSATGSRTPEALLLRFSGALALPGEGLVDSLQLLRIEALGEAPGFAAALGEAVQELRRGGDATPALVRARRALAAGTRGETGLRAWDIAP